MFPVEFVPVADENDHRAARVVKRYLEFAELSSRQRRWRTAWNYALKGLTALLLIGFSIRVVIAAYDMRWWRLLSLVLFVYILSSCFTWLLQSSRVRYRALMKRRRIITVPAFLYEIWRESTPTLSPHQVACLDVLHQVMLKCDDDLRTWLLDDLPVEVRREAVSRVEGVARLNMRRITVKGAAHLILNSR